MHLALIDSLLTHNLNINMCTSLAHCPQLYKEYNKNDLGHKRRNDLSVKGMTGLIGLCVGV